MTINDIIENHKAFTTQDADGNWVPCRIRIGLMPIWRRFKIAYLVFVGKYDAVQWPANQ